MIRRKLFAFRKAIFNALVLFLLGYFLVRVYEKLAQQDISASFFDEWGLVALAIIPFYMLLAISSFMLAGRAFLGSKIQTLDAIEQVGLSVIAKYLPGKLWGIAVRALLCERYSLTASKSVAFSLFELAIATGSGFTAACGLWLWTKYPYYTFPAILALTWVFHRAYLFLVMAITKLREGKTLSLIKKWNFIFIEKVDFLVYAKSTAYYMPIWIVFSIVLNCYINILHDDTAYANRQLLSAYYITSVLVGFLAVFTPGGIGVREGVFVAWAGDLVGYSSAIVLAIFMRLWSTAYDIVFGATSSSVYFFFDSKR